MKRDLDRLMERRNMDALVVAGRTHGNPPLYYMTNGVSLTQGFVFKRRGAEPVLVCSPIEREVAAASGLAVVNMNRYDFTQILREAEDPLAAQVELYRRMFEDLGVKGRVGFYGMADRGKAWVLLNALDERLVDVEIGAEFDETVLDEARATKDVQEAARIREVGRRTCAVVARTLDFLRSHRAGDDVLWRADGEPLTLGDVHATIRALIAEQGLEDPEGFIFSIGRDAGVPHNKGNPEDVVALGRTIVFDIFPREGGGGYFFDMTRTFCLGYAPPEVERAYEDVRGCVEHVTAAYEVGTEVRHYQQLTCEFFEARGHPTIASDRTTEAGYVHTVSHGLGLAVHEDPFFRDAPSNTTRLQPGHVFSCEPGLYYPERGFGIRLEDVIWIDDAGAVHNLTEFPKELVIEV